MNSSVGMLFRRCVFRRNFLQILKIKVIWLIVYPREQKLEFFSMVLVLAYDCFIVDGAAVPEFLLNNRGVKHTWGKLRRVTMYVLTKLEKRQREHNLDPHIEEQFG